jgi:hypothetical protein
MKLISSWRVEYLPTKSQSLNVEYNMLDRIYSKYEQADGNAAKKKVRKQKK